MQTAVPAPPFRYRLFAWRKAMHVSYDDAINTDINIINQDLEMMILENTYTKGSN